MVAPLQLVVRLFPIVVMLPLMACPAFGVIGYGSTEEDAGAEDAGGEDAGGEDAGGEDTDSGTSNPYADRLVFISPQPFEGDLTNQDASKAPHEFADSVCNVAGRVVRPDVGFVAWFSDAQSNAIERVTGSGPFVLPTGAAPFSSIAQLAASTLDNEITTHANGDIVSGYADSQRLQVWTGTTLNGNYTASCNNWSTNSITTYGTIRWVAGFDETSETTCFNTAYFLCIQAE